MIAGGSFVRAFTQGLNSSLSGPYLQGTSPGSTTWGGAGSGEQFPLFPTAARNPNKAIITIDARESRILVANEMTCELFGYQPDELSGMKIQSLFTELYRGKQRALMEQNISISGETFLISGKVVINGIFKYYSTMLFWDSLSCRYFKGDFIGTGMHIGGFFVFGEVLVVY